MSVVTPGAQELLRRRAGFTLVEVMVVLLIIAIVSGIAASGVLRSRDLARESDVQRVLVSVTQAQDRYAMRHNSFATNTAQLQTVGWGSDGVVEVRVLNVSDASYCVEAWLAANSGVIASVRVGEDVQSVSCGERVTVGGGTLSGAP